MTPQRTVAVGLGGAAAVVGAALLSAALGQSIRQVVSDPWPGHATTHVVFGALVLLIALWVGRVHRASVASSTGLAAVRLIAFAVSATAVVEGIGAYPPLALLHYIVIPNLIALVVLLLAFLSIPAVGVRQAVRGRGSWTRGCECRSVHATVWPRASVGPPERST